MSLFEKVIKANEKLESLLEQKAIRGSKNRNFVQAYAELQPNGNLVLKNRDVEIVLDPSAARALSATLDAWYGKS